MEHPEIILQVGAEGGSLTLYGHRTRDGWRFSEETVDQSAAMMSEPELDCQYQAAPVASLDDALKRLDRYPWPHLCPLHVHPDFRAAILAAVIDRLDLAEADDGRLAEWRCA